MKNKKKIALIEIICAGILWGTSAIFVNFLSLYDVSSLQMTFIRAFVSLLLLCVYGSIRDRGMFGNVKSEKELLLFIGSGASFFGTATFYYLSIQTTSVSTAVILMYTAPIFVMIYSILFLSEKLTLLKLVSVIAMLGGCGFISGIIGGLKFDAIGVLFGFLAGLSYSAYNIFVKMEMRQKSNPITATFYCFLIASLMGFVMCDPLQLPSLIAKDVAVLPLMLMLGVCTCILPYFLYTLALKVLPAGIASALAIIEPMSATLFSVVLFSQPMDVFSVCGIILILGAVFLLSRSEE